MCSPETDECQRAFEREPGKGEGPRVNGQNQLLSCAGRNFIRREGEEGEDRPGPDLYMGCALSADSCGDEPDPVPVRRDRGSMRLNKVS